MAPLLIPSQIHLSGLNDDRLEEASNRSPGNPIPDTARAHEIEDLRLKLAVAQDQLKVHNTTIAALQKENHEAKEKIAAQTKNESPESPIADTARAHEIEVLKLKLAVARDQSKAQNATIAALKKENQEAREKIATLTSKLSTNTLPPARLSPASSLHKNTEPTPANCKPVEIKVLNTKTTESFDAKEVEEDKEVPTTKALDIETTGDSDSESEVEEDLEEEATDFEEAPAELEEELTDFDEELAVFGQELAVSDEELVVSDEELTDFEEEPAGDEEEQTYSDVQEGSEEEPAEASESEIEPLWGGRSEAKLLRTDILQFHQALGLVA